MVDPLPKENLATRATNPLLKAMIHLAISLNVFIGFKDESWRMKLLNHFIVRLFNPRFMTDYTTMVSHGHSSTIYFVSQETVHRFEGAHGKIMAHEFVHVHDRRRVGWWRFTMGYLFPQILALPAVLHIACGLLLGALVPHRIAALIVAITATLGAIVLGAVYLSSWTLVLAAFLVFVAPLPAPWRTKWELRGYQMNMALNFWEYGSVSEYTMKWLPSIFTGPGYYFMWPFKKSIEKRLEQAAAEVTSGKVLDDPIFKLIYDNWKTTKNQE